MIDKISLAIPFYNTSKYFLDCIKYSIDDNFVSEIVVNDDQSSEEEWKNINNIISELNNTKIKLYRNSTNLGGFKNKYKTIEKTTLDWVYLLDSDNYLHNTTLNVIKNIQNFDENICYCPETLIMFSGSFGSENIIREINYVYPYDNIGINECKKALISGIENFNMFLNTGNYIFNRNKYLERMKDAYKSDENFSAADCIAFQYNWLKSGGYSKIISNFKYFHRLRDDSYWVSSGQLAPSKASYYESLLYNFNI